MPGSLDMRSMGSDMAALPTWGNNLAPANTPPLRAIQGVSGPVIYAVGDSGTVRKSTDGQSFKDAGRGATENYLALWVVSADHVLLTDDASGMVTSTANGGSQWTQEATLLTGALRGIYGRDVGSGSLRVVVGGDNTSTSSYFDGSLWTLVNHGMGKVVHGAWASSTTYFISGEGGRSRRAADPTMTWTGYGNESGVLRAVTGLDDNSVFAVGSDGKFYSTTSSLTAWTSLLTVSGGLALNAVWARSATEVWVAGVAANNGAVYQCNATTSTCQSRRTATLDGYTLTGVWGDGQGGVWICGFKGAQGGIFKY